MKRALLLIVCVLSVSLLAQTNDYKRPTADVSSVTPFSAGNDIACMASNGSDGFVASPAMTPVYSGKSGTGPTGSSSTQAPGNGQTFERRFTTWQSAVGSYTALTLNISMACTQVNGTDPYFCGASYSTNNGSTWNAFSSDSVMSSGGAWGQQTFSATLSPSQNLSTVQVAVCSASSDGGDGTFGVGDSVVQDIWTNGTLTYPLAATPTLSPSSGTAPLTVTLSTTTTGCGSYIYWSTADNPPTTSDTHGTSVSVSSAETVYADVIGCAGYTNSSVGSATYSGSVVTGSGVFVLTP